MQDTFRQDIKRLKSTLKNIFSFSKDKSILFRLIFRTTLFFALMSIFLFTLYIDGSYKSFLDTTQSFILVLCSLFALLLLIFSIIGIIDCIIMFSMFPQKTYFAYMSIFIIFCILSIVIFLLTRAGSILSKGL